MEVTKLLLSGNGIGVSSPSIAPIKMAFIIFSASWTATILSLAGVKPHKDFPLDGIDLLPVLTAKKQNIQRELYWRIFQRKNEKAVRYGDWKYIADTKGEYLFNIAEDEAEKNNLIARNKEMADKLKKIMANWEKSVLTPIPL